jgi:hypothetical protein
MDKLGHTRRPTSERVRALGNSPDSKRAEHAPYDHFGANFFAYEIDHRWHAGWFRIRDGKLEVSSNCRRKSVEYDATRPEMLTTVLRRLLTEIVEESRAEADEQHRSGSLRGRPMSGTLHKLTSAVIFRHDSATERELQPPRGENSGTE